MKTKLKDKIIKECLERDGQAEVVKALDKVGLTDLMNKCSECNHRIIRKLRVHYIRNNKHKEEIRDYFGCDLDDNVVNAYGCMRDLLGQHAEEIIERPEYPRDDFDSSTLCHEWQIGEREL